MAYWAVAPIAGDPPTPSKEFLEAARYLGSKADFLLIGANTPHLFEKEIGQAAGIEVFSIVDVVVREVRQPEVKKVGALLAKLFVPGIGLHPNRGFFF